MRLISTADLGCAAYRARRFHAVLREAIRGYDRATEDGHEP